MRTLIADCSNFVLQHGVYVIDDQEKEPIQVMHLTTGEIVDYVLSNSEIDKVQLRGIAEFCLGIKEDIENKITLEYSNRKLEIEVL